jgi:predicted transcriptional regulator
MRHYSEIPKRRRARRVSQAEVGIEDRHSQVWVSLVERGSIKVDEATIERLLNAIDTIVARRAAVEDAASRATIDFENRKIPSEGSR